MSKDIMTIEEVADLLRVSERTIYDWAHKGHIPAGKIGTVWRFKRSDIDAWINSKMNSSALSSSAPAVDVGGFVDALSPHHCCVTDYATKQEVLEHLIRLLADSPHVGSSSELHRAIFERERLMSTGIGLGIGIPHVRIASVSRTTMALCVNATPLPDYEAIDGKPVRLVAMIASGSHTHTQYLKLLAQLSARLKDPHIYHTLFNTPLDAARIYQTLCAPVLS